MLAKNLAQTPAGTVAENRATNSPGRNETGARCRDRFGIFQKTEGKHFSANRGSFRPNALKFGIQSETR